MKKFREFINETIERISDGSRVVMDAYSMWFYWSKIVPTDKIKPSKELYNRVNNLYFDLKFKERSKNDSDRIYKIIREISDTSHEELGEISKALKIWQDNKVNEFIIRIEKELDLIEKERLEDENK